MSFVQREFIRGSKRMSLTRSRITPKRRQNMRGPARSVSFSMALSVCFMGFSTDRVCNAQANIITVYKKQLDSDQVGFL